LLQLDKILIEGIRELDLELLLVEQKLQSR